MDTKQFWTLMDKFMGTEEGRKRVSRGLLCDITQQVTEGTLEEIGCTRMALASVLRTNLNIIQHWLSGDRVMQYRFWYRIGAVLHGFIHVKRKAPKVKLEEGPYREEGRPYNSLTREVVRGYETNDRREYSWKVPDHQDIENIYEYSRHGFESREDTMEEKLWWWKALGPRRYNQRKKRVRKEINKIRAHAFEIYKSIFEAAEAASEEKEKELNAAQ